jgi:hypothetical protein
MAREYRKTKHRRKKRTVAKVAVAKSKRTPEQVLRGQAKTAPAIALAPAPPRPSTLQKGKDRAPKRKEPGLELARSLGTAALMFPGGKYGGIVKAGLAGAAAGAELEAGIRKYRKSRKKGSKTQGTVSEKAATQLSKGHKKDPSKTKRV